MQFDSFMGQSIGSMEEDEGSRGVGLDGREEDEENVSWVRMDTSGRLRRNRDGEDLNEAREEEDDDDEDEEEEEEERNAPSGSAVLRNIVSVLIGGETGRRYTLLKFLSCKMQIKVQF